MTTVTHPMALLPQLKQEEKKSVDEKKDHSQSVSVPEEKSIFKQCDWFAIETNTIALVQIGGAHWELLLPLTELQRPNSIFLHSESYMVQDQFSLANMPSHMYEKYTEEADEGRPLFNLDSYFLVSYAKSGKITWQLMYVNYQGYHSIINTPTLRQMLDDLGEKITSGPEKNIKGAICGYRKFFSCSCYKKK